MKATGWPATAVVLWSLSLVLASSRVATPKGLSAPAFSGPKLVAVREVFSAPTPYGDITGEGVSDAEVAAYRRFFDPEWRRYPPAVLRLSGLREVRFCRELAFAGQRRAAVPDFERDVLYLDVERGRHSPTYLRKVIHHELFHVLDWKDDGRLYEDPLWAALNPPGFRYGNGGVNAQNDAGGSVLRHDLPGFLTTYSLAGVEEDKAEVFAHLMLDPEVVEERSRRDPVLRAKAQRIRLLLWRAAPELGAEFWACGR